MKRYYITAPEVMEILGVSPSKAYETIRELNKELRARGFITVAGRIPLRYFNEKFYGGVDELAEIPEREQRDR